MLRKLFILVLVIIAVILFFVFIKKTGREQVPSLPLGAGDYDFSLMHDNLKISRDTRFAGEPYLAISQDGQRLVAAWMNSPVKGKIDINVAVSNDGGVSWSAPMALPHIDPIYSSADVSIAFDNRGVIHLVYIDLEGKEILNIARGSILHTSSKDGGYSWSKPVVVRNSRETSDLAIDRPWIAIDNSGGPMDGRIYVMSISLFSSEQFPHHIYLKYSTDGGQTWSQDTIVDDATHGTGKIKITIGVPSVGADGKLWIVYPGYWTPRCNYPLCLVAAVSNDGGKTFTRHTISKFVLPAKEYLHFHAVAADPLRPGYAFVAWVGGQYDSTASDILISRTTDGGLTWTLPIRINDEVGKGIGQDLPWIAYSPNGTLGLVWRDRRIGGAGATTPFEIYYTYSKDGGASFSSNKKMSDKVSLNKQLPCCNSFLGIALSNDYFHATWSDLREGIWQIFYGKAIIVDNSI